MKKLFLIIAAVAVWTSCGAQTGEKYKDFALPNQDGKEVKLSQTVAANKYTLLDFWASWCGPCMREVPHLKEAYAKYHDKGFEIFAVSYDSDAMAWMGAVKKNEMNWIHVSSVNGWECPTQALYNVRSIPRNFLIDANGTIVAENLRGDDLTAKLAELFK